MVIENSTKSNHQEDEEKSLIGRGLEGENNVSFDGSKDFDKFMGKVTNATIILGRGSYRTMDHFWVCYFPESF